MTDLQANLFSRPDTFFGVCEGLGQDLRIHPSLFRVIFAGMVFWNPVVALGAYAACGVLVGLTRWLHPNPKVGEARADTPPASLPEAAQAPAADSAEADRVLLAA